MNKEGLTIYTQKGGYKAMGWSVNNTILKGGGSDLVIPATLLYINNNFNCDKLNCKDSGVISDDLYNKLYSFIDKSVTNKKKTKKRRNKTRRY